MSQRSASSVYSDTSSEIKQKLVGDHISCNCSTYSLQHKQSHEMLTITGEPCQRLARAAEREEDLRATYQNLFKRGVEEGRAQVEEWMEANLEDLLQKALELGREEGREEERKFVLEESSRLREEILGETPKFLTPGSRAKLEEVKQNDLSDDVEARADKPSRTRHAFLRAKDLVKGTVGKAKAKRDGFARVEEK